MPDVDIHRVALRIASQKRIAADSAMDTLPVYISDVFDPMQKNLSSLMPMLTRVAKNYATLQSQGKNDAVDALLKKYLADIDLRTIKDGYARYRWRDILEFMKKLITTLKEIDDPMDQLVQGNATTVSE